MDLLIASGADVNAKNGEGSSALRLATIARHNNLFELLKHDGAKKDQTGLEPAKEFPFETESKRANNKLLTELIYDEY